MQVAVTGRQRPRRSQTRDSARHRASVPGCRAPCLRRCVCQAQSRARGVPGAGADQCDRAHRATLIRTRSPAASATALRSCRAPTTCRRPRRARADGRDRRRVQRPERRGRPGRPTVAVRPARLWRRLLHEGQPERRDQPAARPAGTTGWAVEESLDLDMVSAICPLCHIILVEATSASTATSARAVNAAVDARRQVRLQQLRRPRVDLGHHARHRSTSTTRASRSPPPPATTATASMYPAASPNVIAVGGTSLTTATRTRAAGPSRSGTPARAARAPAPAARPYERQADLADATPAAPRRTDNDVVGGRRPDHRRRGLRHLQRQRRLDRGRRHQRLLADHRRASTRSAGTPAAGSNPASDLYAHTGNLFDVTTGRQRHLQPGLPVHRRGRLRRPDRPGHPERHRGVHRRHHDRQHGHGDQPGQPDHGTVGTAVSLQIHAHRLGLRPDADLLAPPACPPACRSAPPPA